MPGVWQPCSVTVSTLHLCAAQVAVRPVKIPFHFRWSIKVLAAAPLDSFKCLTGCREPAIHLTACKCWGIMPRSFLQHIEIFWPKVSSRTFCVCFLPLFLSSLFLILVFFPDVCLWKQFHSKIRAWRICSL